MDFSNNRFWRKADIHKRAMSVKCQNKLSCALGRRARSLERLSSRRCNVAARDPRRPGQARRRGSKIEERPNKQWRFRSMRNVNGRKQCAKRAFILAVRLQCPRPRLICLRTMDAPHDLNIPWELIIKAGPYVIVADLGGARRMCKSYLARL